MTAKKKTHHEETKEARQKITWRDRGKLKSSGMNLIKMIDEMAIMHREAVLGQLIEETPDIQKWIGHKNVKRIPKEALRQIDFQAYMEFLRKAGAARSGVIGKLENVVSGIEDKEDAHNAVLGDLFSGEVLDTWGLAKDKLKKREGN